VHSKFVSIFIIYIISEHLRFRTVDCCAGW